LKNTGLHFFSSIYDYSINGKWTCSDSIPEMHLTTGFIEEWNMKSQFT